MNFIDGELSSDFIKDLKKLFLQYNIKSNKLSSDEKINCVSWFVNNEHDSYICFNSVGCDAIDIESKNNSVEYYSGGELFAIVDLNSIKNNFDSSYDIIACSFYKNNNFDFSMWIKFDEYDFAIRSLQQARLDGIK